MDGVQPLTLEEQFKNALEEARIVLPGIQALFGFQLVAIFNERFAKGLGYQDQVIHLAATALSAIAVGLALTPAALHRQAEPKEVSQELVDCASGFLTAALVPLTLGTAADFYVVSKLVLPDAGQPLAVSAVLFGFLTFFWFVYPQFVRIRRRRSPRRESG